MLNFRFHNDEREFPHMLHSAAIGDRNNFKDTLGQVHYVWPGASNRDIHRHSNEDDGPFTRTTHGVMKDVSYLRKRDRNKVCLLNNLVMVLILTTCLTAQWLPSKTMFNILDKPLYTVCLPVSCLCREAVFDYITAPRSFPCVSVYRATEQCL